MPADTVCAALAEQVARDPRALAAVEGGARLDYGDLADAVGRFATLLSGRGVTAGDRVAVLTPPGLLFWVSFLATARIGAIWVGLGTRHQREELGYAIGDCRPRLVISVPSFEGRAYEADLTAAIGRLETPAELVMLSGLDAAPAATAALLSAAPAAGAPALIVYTSGTTGRPKGALLSHAALIGGARAQLSVYRNPGRPVQICSFPTNHIACIGDVCLTNLVAGGVLIFTPRFDPDEQLAIMERESVTVWGGIPTMLMLMLSRPVLAGTDLSTIAYIVWGGAAMPAAIVDSLGRFPARRVAVYGMTETCCNVTHSPEGAGSEALAGSIGVPLGDVVIRIEAGSDGAGELEIRSPFNMLGYWERPDATRDAFTADGYLRTGDVGRWNADGSITLVGRRTEMFKSGGFNVYPREVELAIEAEAGIVAAAVVSVPDPLFGEVGHAFAMVGDPGATVENVLAGLRSRIANYKIPKRLTLLPMLPILANGKIDKVELRARALAS